MTDTSNFGTCGRHEKRFEIREEHPDPQHGGSDHVAVTRYCVLCVIERLMNEIKAYRLAAKAVVRAWEQLAECEDEFGRDSAAWSERSDLLDQAIIHVRALLSQVDS